MQSIIPNHQLTPGVFLWYDGLQCLYSTTHLEPQVKLQPDGQYRLNIKLCVNRWSTKDINDFVNGKTRIYPHDAVRVIEILLKRAIQVVKNKCYFLAKPRVELHNGFEQHFIQRQLGSDRIPTNLDFPRLNNLLRNCIILTKQSDWKTEYEFDSFDSRRPHEIIFDSGEAMTDYYGRLKIQLTKLDHPCIQVYRRNYERPCHLPLELRKIKEWTIYNKPLQRKHEHGTHIVIMISKTHCKSVIIIPTHFVKQCSTFTSTKYSIRS
ncbi:unnamed protein product [Adineta ricciae]|uniref:Uncharacterized protein n=1 Tax=Adineta ricciae TaxID=249248 RepID=A0A814PB80_ADIRI|nr:unnamed protein product [Adineta ricciae]CAF1105512.1 unnamed protein product [Adineta ricciae]